LLKFGSGGQREQDRYLVSTSPKTSSAALMQFPLHTGQII